MSKFFCTVLAFGILAWSGLACAAVGTYAYIEGTVRSWDKKQVKLELQNGKKISIKREWIPTYYTLREGVPVTAYLTQEEFVKSASGK